MKQWKMESEIGPLYIVASEKGIRGIFWKKQNAPMIRSLKESEALSDCVRQIEEYLSGKRRTFDVLLDIQGTEFQKKVWHHLQKIPYGKTISYKELASRVGQKRAFRAVGTANGKNPLSLIIPCHRVIAANGTLGGYAGGLAIKKTLLTIESK